jgi:hypothetical protein
MIEAISKFSTMFKALGFPILFLMTLNPGKQLKSLKKISSIEDDVPGDNFPHVFMTHAH